MSAAGAATEDQALQQEGDRITQLIDDLGEIGGAPVRTRVEELVRRLVHLYGAGLERMLRILGGALADPAARARLGADPLVSSLLVLHGIHPDAQAAAAAFDPGPEAAPPPARVPAAAASGLVQIDLGRSRAGKTEDAR